MNILFNGQVVFTGTVPPYQYRFTVPTSVTSLIISATAVDYGNNVGTASNVTLNVIPDLGTTTTRTVVNAQGNPVSGATVSALGLQTSTQADGTFALAGLPTVRGPITVNATAVVGGITLAGLSQPVAPVQGGITNVGTIQIVPKPIIASIAPRGVLAGTTQNNFIVTGANLTETNYSLLPATSPTPIAFTVNSVNPSGTVANLTDGVEVATGSDPLDSKSTPHTGAKPGNVNSFPFSVSNLSTSRSPTVGEADGFPFSVQNTATSGSSTTAEADSFRSQC